MVVILIPYTVAGGKVSPQEFIKPVQKALPGEYGAYIYIVSNNDTFDFEAQKAKIENILVEDDPGKRIVVVPNEKISTFKECLKNFHFEEDTIPSNIYQQVEKSVQESCDGTHLTLGTIEIGKILKPVAPEISEPKIPITQKPNSQKWIVFIALLVLVNIFITLYGTFNKTATLLSNSQMTEEQVQKLRALNETQGQTITVQKQQIKVLQKERDALKKNITELIEAKGISEPAKLFEPLLPKLRRGSNRLVVGTYGSTDEAEKEVNRLKVIFSSLEVGYKEVAGQQLVYIGDFYSSTSAKSLLTWCKGHGIIARGYARHKSKW